MKIVLVIQARMGSTRLPGKVLRDLCGKTVLERVVDRCRGIRSIGQLVVATSTHGRDQVIVDQCASFGAAVYRGSEHDVLDRYYQAAIRYEADAVVRITGDCPLIDPVVSSQVIDLFMQQTSDYASNVEPRCYPQGLDTEVFTFQALRAAWKDANQSYERSHVTTYIRTRPDRFKALGLQANQDYSHLRWTLDTPDDWRFIQAVYEGLEDVEVFGWRDVLHLMKCQPQLYHLNRHVRQKVVQEG